MFNKITKRKKLERSEHDSPESLQITKKNQSKVKTNKWIHQDIVSADYSSQLISSAQKRESSDSELEEWTQMNMKRGKVKPLVQLPFLNNSKELIKDTNLDELLLCVNRCRKEATETVECGNRRSKEISNFQTQLVEELVELEEFSIRETEKLTVLEELKEYFGTLYNCFESKKEQIENLRGKINKREEANTKIRIRASINEELLLQEPRESSNCIYEQIFYDTNEDFYNPQLILENFNRLLNLGTGIYYQVGGPNLIEYFTDILLKIDTLLFFPGNDLSSIPCSVILSSFPDIQVTYIKRKLLKRHLIVRSQDFILQLNPFSRGETQGLVTYLKELRSTYSTDISFQIQSVFTYIRSIVDSYEITSLDTLLGLYETTIL